MIRQDIYPSILKHHSRRLAILDTAAENEHREAIKDFLLDQAGERSSTICRTIARTGEIVFDIKTTFDSDIPAIGLQSLLNLLNADIDDLSNFLARKAIEDDNRGNTIEEFREEIVAESLHDHF